MKILLLGSGGREHALAWKLAQSPLLTTLYIAPGNAGTQQCGINVPIQVTDFPAIKAFVLRESISMVVVGPEDPLVKGIHDFFLADQEICHVPVIGPKAIAAQLEGSKDFAKQFMMRHGIPTAAYQTFNQTTLEAGISYLRNSRPPYVLKADGLAAGKGVVICSDLDSAIEELKRMLIERKFGNASNEVVIEQFLSGIELSVFVLTDGKSYLLLPEAKDYKKIGEKDTGPNTGGMGSISPVPFADALFMNKVIERVIRPTMDGLQKDGIDYQGFIFFGLINVGGDPYVIEYNCRMGDPETESVMPRIESDLVALFHAVAQRNLHEQSISVNPHFATTVMLVSQGYPDHYEKGKVITGEENVEGSLVFHAGTAVDSSRSCITTNGGRVIAVTSLGSSMQEALRKSNRNAQIIQYEGKYFRTDIGFDL